MSPTFQTKSGMTKKVQDYMQSSVISIRKDEQLDKAMRLMSTSRISHLPVVDTNNIILGVISKEDVLAEVIKILNQEPGSIPADKILRTIKVSDIMTSAVVVVQPSDSIDLAIEILLQREMHCVPVVQDQILLGIVTSFDLLKGYYEETD